MSFRLPAIFIFPIVVPLFICAIEAYGYNPVNDEEALALQNLRAISGEDIGPETIKRTGSDRTSPQDATMTLMDIRRNWNKRSPMFRDIAGGYFLKKSPGTYTPIPPNPPFVKRGNGRIEKGGINDEGNGSMSRMANLGDRKMVRGVRLLPNWVETENLSIEWGNTPDFNFNRDNGRDSDKILACSKGPPCTGIPDTIDNWVDYFEAAWEKEIRGLGYTRPTGTETYLYDIYIANTGNGTPAISSSLYGYTATYCDNQYFSICKDDVANSLSYIIVNGSISDTQTMMITAAHELFHAIQFSYPSIDDWFSLGNSWWIEATATWMEDVVYDDVNDYYTRIINWLKYPWLSLKYSGNSYTDHEYGDALFIFFVTDVYLRDQSFVRYVWENGKSGIEAIDSTLSDRYNSNFESAFKEFAALNAVADRSSAWGGYEEGFQYGSVAVTMTHTGYPVPLFEISGENAPQELGSNYIQFIPPSNDDNSLVIEFDGSDNVNWAAMVVKIRGDGSGFEREEMVLASPQKYGCHSIEEFGTMYSEVFLVPVVLVDPALSGTAPYNYSASLNGVCDHTANAYLMQADSSSDTGNNNKTDNGRCFIATAAFGSAESPFVRVLRDFRDEYLIPYSIGRRFISLYYTVSPSMADFIEQHPPAPFFVRIALLPAIGVAFLFIKTTFLEKMALILIVLFLCVKQPLHIPAYPKKLTK